MKKILSLLCLALFLVSALFLTGCGKDTASAKRVDIFFPAGLARFEASGQTLKSSLEGQGFTVNLQFAATADEQGQQIEKAASDGTNCVVIAAVDSKAVGSSLAKAKEKKIPIIAYDRLPLNTDAVDYYATFDNEGIGVAMAKYVENKFNLKQNGGPLYH